MKQANLVKQRKSAPKHLLALLPSLLPAVRILEAKLAESDGADLTVSVATPQGHRRTLLIDIEPSPAAGRVRESIRGLKDASAGTRRMTFGPDSAGRRSSACAHRATDAASSTYHSTTCTPWTNGARRDAAAKPVAA